MQKKGQITIFIILGLILLAAAIIMIGIQKKMSGTLQTIPLELQPVVNEAKGCLITTLNEGIKLIGKYGGYIEPDVKRSGIEFTQSYKIPYWWYMKSDYRCTQCEFSGDQIPPLKRDQTRMSIEEQLDVYIEQHLDRCLEPLLEMRGYTVQSAEKEVTTTIEENEIEITVNYPLLLLKESTTVTLPALTTRSKSSLKTTYDIAVNITMNEARLHFLENSMLDIITLHAGIDENKLPPMSGSEFGKAATTWNAVDVEMNIKSLLQSYIPLLKITGAKNAIGYKLSSDVPYSALVNSVTGAILSHMTMDIVDLDSQTVNFYYFNTWDTYIALNAKSGIISAQSSSSSLLPGINLGINRYSTVYDLTYPVVVELQNQELTWRFALQGNIRNNKALTENVALQTPFFDTASLFCDENQRTSGESTIHVVNKRGNTPVSDAVVAFTSVDQCILGTTDENGMYRGRFPVGIGLLKISAPHFESTVLPLSTYVEDPFTLTVPVSEIQKVKVTASKRKVESGKLGGRESLSLNDSLIVTFTRNAVIEDGVTLQNNEGGFVSLSPGLYTVNVFLFTDSPQSTAPLCIDLLSQECMTITNLPPKGTEYSLEWEYKNQPSLALTGIYSDTLSSIEDIALTQKQVLLP